MFGTEHIAPVQIQSNRITKGNTNSGAKRHLSEKLKDFCANTQRTWKQKLQPIFNFKATVRTFYLTFRNNPSSELTLDSKNSLYVAT